MRATAADIALEFLDRINSHDIGLVSELITEDHVYIDAQGSQLRGKRPVERSWRACFEWFPDYSIQVDQAFANGNIAVVTGCAMGTFAVHGRLSRDNRWTTPSAWQAVVRNQKIAEWRVYADNEPVWKVMRERRYGSEHPIRSVSPFSPSAGNS